MLGWKTKVGLRPAWPFSKTLSQQQAKADLRLGRINSQCISHDRTKGLGILTVEVRVKFLARCGGLSLLASPWEVESGSQEICVILDYIVSEGTCVLWGAPHWTLG